jgi:epoxyqueuosine reductase
MELREPMGLWVYGCDLCQNVCPRNAPWLAKTLPLNPKVVAMQDDFELPKLLQMDENYFKQRIWPHMFYMGAGDIWRWQMNAARALGNTRDACYLEDLATALKNNPDPRVRGMAAWALGRIGGERAVALLEERLNGVEEQVAQEIINALERCSRK